MKTCRRSSQTTRPMMIRGVRDECGVFLRSGCWNVHRVGGVPVNPCSTCGARHWRLAEQSVRDDEMVTHTCVNCGTETEDKFRYDGRESWRKFSVGKEASSRGTWRL